MAEDRPSLEDITGWYDWLRDIASELGGLKRPKTDGEQYRKSYLLEERKATKRKLTALGLPHHRPRDLEQAVTFGAELVRLKRGKRIPARLSYEDQATMAEALLAQEADMDQTATQAAALETGDRAREVITEEDTWIQ